MKRNLLITILVIIVGTLLLRVFVPWWGISLLMGTVSVLAIYAWVTENTPIPEKWAKRILLIVATIFAISLILSFVSQKWPWLDEAFDERQFYSSLVATDLVDPKYPDLLARSVYQTERMKIRAEENQLNGLLAVTQRKLADGIPLTVTDEAVVKRAKERLVALDKELASVNLARQKTETSDSKPIGSWPWRMMVFGGLLLAAIIFIPSRINLPGRRLIGWVGAMMFVAGLALIFFPEAQAKLTEKPPGNGGRAVASATHRAAAAATRLPANAVFAATLPEGKIVYVKRKRMDAPPPERWSKDSDGKITVVRAWPPGEETRSYRNDLPGTDNLYIVPPPGLTLADFEISATDPALNKQVARAPVAPTAPAAPAPVPDGKYTWNGRYGYPEDR